MSKCGGESCLILAGGSYLKTPYIYSIVCNTIITFIYIIVCDPYLSLREKLMVSPSFRRNRGRERRDEVRFITLAHGRAGTTSYFKFIPKLNYLILRLYSL